MGLYTPEYVITILLNQDDLLSYSKRIGQEDHMSIYMDAVNDLERIKSVLKRLPKGHQERIQVFLFSGLTQTEMAEKLGTKQPNVKRNFMRSLNRLVHILNIRIQRAQERRKRA